MMNIGQFISEFNIGYLLQITVEGVMF